MFAGDIQLRAGGEVVDLTAHEINEYIKCQKDPMYFIENYIFIDTLWFGKPQKTNFKPEQYQKNLINKIHNGRFVIGKLSRQVGKSTAVNAYAVWCLYFVEGYRILSAANKEKSARNNMNTIKEMIRNVPLWLQEGVTIWNATSISFENGSTFQIETTTPDSGRSGTYSMVILDEFAFVDSEIAAEFYQSSYPTITSGKESKLVVISTPNGMNHFYDMWNKAVLGKSDFDHVEIKWNDVPGRDEAFKASIINNTSLESWLQEFECIFAGAQNALVRSDKLTEAEISTIFTDDENGMYTFHKPEENRSYFMTVDVARGREGDNSAFIVFDVTEIPYRVVCTYANNTIEPMAFPNIIHEIASKYNSAPVLIELNDAGQEVADVLVAINEYWNVLYTSKKDGLTILGGNDGKLPGITTTGPTKSKGCTTLRVLIENKQLILSDFRLKTELSNFVLQGQSYKASAGNKDDMAMCLHSKNIVETEDGPKQISWIVNNKYTGKVLSLHENGEFVWRKVVGHSCKENKTKKTMDFIRIWK